MNGGISGTLGLDLLPVLVDRRALEGRLVLLRGDRSRLDDRSLRDSRAECGALGREGREDLLGDRKLLVDVGAESGTSSWYFRRLRVGVLASRSLRCFLISLSTEMT